MQRTHNSETHIHGVATFVTREESNPGQETGLLERTVAVGPDTHMQIQTKALTPVSRQNFFKMDH